MSKKGKATPRSDPEGAAPGRTSPSSTDDQQSVPTAPNRKLTHSNYLRPAYSSELIVAEEESWSKINRLNQLPDTYENRQALADEYKALAFHYSRVGGKEATARYLRRAIELDNDPELRRWLAQAEGHAGDLRFIISYEDLLASGQVDLRVALEYCFFLEMKGYHSAALEIFGRTFDGRSLTTEEERALDSFFALILSPGTIGAHTVLQDYRDLARSILPRHELNEDPTSLPTLFSG